MDHKTWMEHFSAAVIVPAAWAVSAAVFVSIAAFAIALAFQVIAGTGDPRFWALTLGGLTLPSVYFYALDWWARQITPPVPRPAVYESQDTLITYYRNADTPYLSGDYDHINLPKAKLVAACKELVERNFRTAAFGGAGQILSRSEAETLREYLFKRGLAYRDNPNQTNSTWTITPEGREFILETASPSTHPDIGNYAHKAK